MEVGVAKWEEEGGEGGREGGKKVDIDIKY